MKRVAFALLVSVASAAGADEPAPPPIVDARLSPLRAELAVAVEEYHAAERRLHRGGPEGDERDELRGAMRRARRRVKALKRQILKDEKRRDDYYQDDPYPKHKRDPETGGPFRP